MNAGILRCAAAAVCAVVLAGCTLGPKYRKPQVPVPPAFRNAPDAQEGASASSIADLPWWQVFKDPMLQELIRTAIDRNYDVRVAAEQIIAAREQAGVSRGAQLPQVSLNPSYNGGKDQLSGLYNRESLVGLVANVNYQLDLFGGLRRATEASRASLLASEEARRTVVLTLVSDVATNYYQLLSLDAQLQISLDAVKSQETTVRLTMLRVERGAAAKVDLLQAQQALDAANAAIPSLQRQISRTEDALSILLGNYPEGVPRGATLAEQPVPPLVPAGITSALIEHRPDIRRAEANLIAANAQIGVARAALFPQISLTSALGRSDVFSSLMSPQASSFGLGSGASSVYTLGASLMQPVFEGGRLRSTVRVAESQQRQALLGYMHTIQKAFGDVSDALIDYQKYHEVSARQEQYVSDLSESLRLANMRYTSGSTTYLEVLDAQRSLFAEQLILAQSRGLEFQSAVQLYKALGGGWRN